MAGNDPRPYYKAMVEALDTEIGRLLEGVPADTTIIVVGDNGTPDFAPTGELTADRLKRSPFEGGLRVPLIVTGPYVDEPGSWSEAFVHIADVFATVAEIAHVDLSEVLGPDGQPLRLDGQSLLPFVKHPGAPSARSVLFSEFFGPNGPPPYQEGFRTVRDRDFKLIRSLVGEPDQLYDLRGRVFEGEDLLPQGLDSEQQRTYDELSETLERMLAERPYEGPSQN
jgi:arylsulfatase A-like enzyme